MSTYTDASLIVTPNAYKAGKLYSLKPTDGAGDLDVVRATTATYVGSDGLIKTALANEPRIDYTNGSCPSILVEPQRTNLLTYSEDFSNASWTSLSVNTSVSIDVVSSPNGLNTADLIIANALTSNSIFIRETIILPSTGIYTFSVYAKKQNQNIIGIRSLASGLLINYDLEAETSSAGFIDNVGGGWFRIGFSYSSSTINESIYIYPLGTGTRTGNGIDGVYIWGAQLEAGANATSYIPTVASAVTRNADVISKTGISDLIGQTEGSIVCKFNFQNSNFSRYIFSLYKSGGFELEHLSLLLLSNNETLRFTFKNSTEILNNDFTLTSDGNNEFVVTYDSTETKFYINKSLVGTLSGKTPPITNSLIIGARSNFSSFFSGMIDNVQLYKNVLTELEINDI